MKNWLKQQITEFTAWIGLFIIIAAFIAPQWLIVLLGIILISIDDEKASALIRKITPFLHEKIDGNDDR